MPDIPDDDRWRDWTYSEAVAAGAYGDADSHVDASGALTADSVQGQPVPPKLGRTERAPLVRRPHRS